MKKTVSFFRNLICKDNRGYTLVELIVAVAIFAMVSVAIVGMINITTKSYKTDTTEINLQYEAQQTVNQIKELIVDTNRGVNFINDGSETALYIYNETETVDPSGVSTLEFPVIKIVYDSANQELKYVYKTFASPDAISIPGAFDDASEGLLGEYVKDFDVDLSNIANDEVKLDITFESSDREYSTTPTVSMRNKIIVSDSVRDIYTGTAVPRSSYILGVAIFKNGSKVVDGISLNYSPSVQTVKFDAVIDSIGIHDEASWTLTGATASSVSSDGTVSVDPADRGVSMTLTATSKSDPQKKASISIFVASYDLNKGYVSSFSLKGQTETGNALETDITTGSRTYYFDTIITYINEDKLTPDKKGVTWSISPSNIEGVTFNTTTGKASCDYRASGKTFTITATTKAEDTDGNKKTDSKTVTVATMTKPEDNRPVTPTITWGGDLADVSTLNRNSQYTISAKVNSVSVYQYEWSIEYLSNFNDGNWSDLDNRSLVTITKSDTGITGNPSSYYSQYGSQATVNVSADLDWDKTFKIRVVVKAKYRENNQNKQVTSSLDYTINPVTMTISADKSSISYNSYRTNKPVKLTVNITGYNLPSGTELSQYCYIRKGNNNGWGNTTENYNVFWVSSTANYDGTYNLYLNANYEYDSKWRYTKGYVQLSYSRRFDYYEYNEMTSNTIEILVDY